MSKMIFVNLPVKNLAAATRFYEATGCNKNERFSDDKASSMVWSDTITFSNCTCHILRGATVLHLSLTSLAQLPVQENDDDHTP